MLLKFMGACATIGLLTTGSLVSADEGADIYLQGCSACHSSGAAGAPKLGDQAAWAPRLKQGKDALVASALNGKNTMPAKGMCPSCSEEQIALAVDYILGSLK